MFQIRDMMVAASLCAVCIAGCGPNDWNVYKSPDFAPDTLRDKKVLLVSDACVRRFTKDVKPYVCLSDSRRAAEKLSRGLAAYMTSQGITEPVIGPVSAGGAVDTEKKWQVSRYPLGKTAVKPPPYWTSDQWRKLSGGDGHEAVRCLIAPICAKFRSDPKSVSELDAKTEFREIVQKLGKSGECDYVLLTTSQSWISGYEIRLKTALPQGIITAIATLGTVSAAVFPVTYISTHVVLVDARTGELVWANSYTNGGNDNRLALQLYDGEGWDLRYDDEGRFDSDLVAGIPDPKVQSWCRKPWNGPWLEWSKYLLYHLPDRQK